MIQRYAAQDPMDEIRKAFVTRSGQRWTQRDVRAFRYRKIWDTKTMGKTVEMFDGRDCKC